MRTWSLLPDLRGGDPMLHSGSDRCWCASCGLYFNSTFAFDRHLRGKLGTPERRCLTSAELRNSGWRQGDRGHWLSPSKSQIRGSVLLKA